MSSTSFAAERRRMVERQLRKRGITDTRVLQAMEEVPREAFVDESDPAFVYGDHAFGIDCEQTISQPYMVALMTEALELHGPERVLEVGTGSGYQSAVLARLAAEVYTIERHEPLMQQARQCLRGLGVGNVHFRCGDGTEGWAEQGPFDRIIVTAGAKKCPRSLLDQLAAEGILVGPFGGEDRQMLQKFTRRGTDFAVTQLTPCRFVPLIGSPSE